MVGDTQHDAEVAAALGTGCVLYTGGHQSRKRLEAVCPHVIDDLAQLPRCWKPYNVNLTTSDLQKSRWFVLAAALSVPHSLAPPLSLRYLPPDRGKSFSKGELQTGNFAWIAKASHFGGGGCDQREQTERARLFASTTYLSLYAPRQRKFTENSFKNRLK